MPGAFTEEGEPNRPIVFWSGAISNIPAGWVLCDGNNGTPDMRERFVRGTANATTSTGSTNGEDEFYLNDAHLPEHSHTASTSKDGDHKHTVSIYTQPDIDRYLNTGPPERPNNDDYSAETETTGAHTHPTTISDTGSWDWIDNRPQYYEVAYITPL